MLFLVKTTHFALIADFVRSSVGRILVLEIQFLYCGENSCTGDSISVLWGELLYRGSSNGDGGAGMDGGNGMETVCTQRASHCLQRPTDAWRIVPFGIK